MEQGTLGELFLTRSVTKHIRKNNKKLLQGAAVGNDYSAIRLTEGIIVNAEGISETPYVAWIKAMNNFAVSGGTAALVRIGMLLPLETEEASIKTYMACFNRLADDDGIQIAGGHTQVSPIYNRPSFVVNVTGSCMEDKIFSRKKCVGYDIVMAGYAGLMGTDVIARERFEQLTGRYAPSYIRGGFFPKEDYSISGVVAEVMSHREEHGCEVVYMHDISHGGVYGALWQLGSWLNQGIKIDHFSIPIKQETIEVCEYFDINPYLLEGTGGLLMVTDKGEQLVHDLCSKSIKAAVIGKVTETKDRVVCLSDDGEKRFLAPVKGDEIYKVIK